MTTLEKKWVVDWSELDIISNAVSQGMEYMATCTEASKKEDTAVLKDNKKILANSLVTKTKLQRILNMRLNDNIKIRKISNLLEGKND